MGNIVQLDPDVVSGRVDIFDLALVALVLIILVTYRAGNLLTYGILKMSP